MIFPESERKREGEQESKREIKPRLWSIISTRILAIESKAIY